MLRKYIISILLVFIYIFAVNVSFLPSMLSTRWLLVIPGFILIMLYYTILNRRSIHYRKKIRPFWKSLFFFYLMVLVSSIVNQRFDQGYSLFPITIALIVTSSFCLVFLLNKIWKKIDSSLYFNIFVIVSAIHLILAVLMFFFPFIETFLFKIIEESALEKRVNDVTSLYRFHTIGISYFGAGVLYSYCILILFLLSQLKQKLLNNWIVVFLIIFIFFVGSAVSRTTMMGLFVGLAFLGFNFSKMSVVSKIKSFSKFILLILFGVCIITYIFDNFIVSISILDSVTEHAFEAFTNLINDGKFRTDSSDIMFEAYKWPDNIKTWLVGDARLHGNDSYTYYMLTDIGWCRLIFDFGILGTFAFIFMQWKLLKVVFVKKNNYMFVYLLFLSFQFKGISELLVFFMPAAMSHLFNEPNKTCDL